jgi:hypothetical protein
LKKEKTGEKNNNKKKGGNKILREMVGEKKMWEENLGK